MILKLVNNLFQKIYNMENIHFNRRDIPKNKFKIFSNIQTYLLSFII